MILRLPRRAAREKEANGHENETGSKQLINLVMYYQFTSNVAMDMPLDDRLYAEAFIAAFIRCKITENILVERDVFFEQLRDCWSEGFEQHGLNEAALNAIATFDGDLIFNFYLNWHGKTKETPGFYDWRI